MCGLNGIASKSTVELSNRDWLAKGLAAMRHRGPDDTGEWWSGDGRVGLGHGRLSILDLSSAGHQPMHYNELGLHIVFNGEIYNYDDLREELRKIGHQFNSRTDTEVILHAYKAWGDSFIQRLSGMFSIALYDEQQQRLILVRDRAGEKPLFYANLGKQLVFASELKGMLTHQAISRKINPGSLDCLLSMGYVTTDRCILQGVKKLKPAHALIFDIQTGESKTWRYWSPPEFDSSLQLSENELLYELESLLLDAVNRQLVADVPVGILLSGGVDSSIITALAAKSGKKISTYTVSFPGYGRFDESPHARLIANHFGTQHMELECTDVATSLLPKLAIQYDEPLVDSSMIPTFLLTELIRKHCKVALGGDGGDELFGGYEHHSRLLWMADKTNHIPRFLRRFVSSLSGFLPVGFKGRAWAKNFGADIQKKLPQIAQVYDRTWRKGLLSAHADWPLIAEEVWDNEIDADMDLVQRATRMDFHHYLPDDILVKVDRASMLNSLEMRAPMLDHRVIEFAFGKVPPHLKANTSNRKILLKKLTARLLPDEFDKKRKQGFGIPLGQWLRSGEWYDYSKDILLSSNSLFDQKKVESVFCSHKKGHENTERLFALIMIQLWAQHYRLSL